MNELHGGTNADVDTGFDIEAELARFEAAERKRLGLPPAAGAGADGGGGGFEHWRDEVHSRFTAAQREHTTLLICGLTMAHDLFCQAALRGIGYRVQALDVPDDEALQHGKEYGNRGQCNPTYFTVGNLVKHLKHLEAGGMPREDIIGKHVFLTAGACGPCRFGTYVTEYRKALRDSGFEGFRVLLFQQTGGLKQATGEGAGLEMNPTFFVSILKAIVLGDVLNALGYRIRPYEVEAGATDAALERVKSWIAEALENRHWIAPVLWRCRRELGAVKVDRTRVKPKVGIIGEFWAMTTEGDGNYRLPRFLEKEGAEVEVQLVTAWLLYMMWQGRYDTRQRMTLRGLDTGKRGLAGVDVTKRLLGLSVAENALRGFFQTVAHAFGLYGYHLPDMDELAEVSHRFYDNQLRGGEGHMEVGKLILNIAKAKVNLTISVKPFGCMPSSSVSDGVQSLITAMYPRGIFLPIETSGDGAVNVYSRIQMQLFKAKKAAEREVEEGLADAGLRTLDEARAHALAYGLAHAFHRSPHRAGCTAADLVHEVGARRHPLRTAGRTLLGFWNAWRGTGDGHAPKLAEVAREAAAKAPAPAPVVATRAPHDDRAAEDRPKLPSGFRPLPLVPR